MPRDLKWRVDLDGEANVVAGLKRIKKGLEDTTDATDNNTASVARQARQARQVINQDKYEAQIWLAKHERVRKLSESFSLLSRVMHVAVTAQNAYNLTQLVFGQKNAERMSEQRNVDQAKRQLELLKVQGASARQIADANEDLAIAKQRLKEFDDQAKSQNISNIVQLVTTFGYLGSSVGHIVTKAPQMINLFRRIGGFFGGGGSAGGGSFPGVSGSRPGFGGSAGGVYGANPIVGGRCMSLCSETVSRLGDKLGEKISGALSIAIPAIAGAVIGTVLSQNIQTPNATPPGTTPPTMSPTTPAGSGNVPANTPATQPAKQTQKTNEDIKKLWDQNFYINKSAQTSIIANAQTVKQNDQQIVQNAQGIGKSTGLLDQIGAAAVISWSAATSYITKGLNDIYARITNASNNAPLGFAPSVATPGTPITLVGSGGKTASVGGAYINSGGAIVGTGKYSSGSSSFSVFPARAAGFSGTVSRPTMIKVGEAGAEHVEVTPAGARRGYMGGSTVIVNYHINGATKDLMRELDAHRKQNLRRRNIGV